MSKGKKPTKTLQNRRKAEEIHHPPDPRKGLFREGQGGPPRALRRKNCDKNFGKIENQERRRFDADSEGDEHPEEGQSRQYHQAVRGA